ncbi:MAG: glycogen synthase [Candidatus Kapabacteria bacterium]|nr:glycogen synthase [Candidatus Kapabacteria bacterium]
MNIIIATTELVPYAKTGGLADITEFLPLEWQKFGQNPIIILPKYGFIDTDYWGFKPTNKILNIPISYWHEHPRLWQGFLPNSNVPVYLVEYDEYFNRPGIYGSPEEYPDNDRRFIFFCRAVMETAKVLNFHPDILHAHDFHAAFTLAFLKTHYKHDIQFARTAGVLTIHNLAYQGWFFPDRAMNLAGFSSKDFYPGCWFEQKGMLNAMKTGIMFADKITTVSQTYADEIRTPYYSEGLQESLNIRGGDLVGVLNGIDYTQWSPDKDEYLTHKYDIDSLDKKRNNKYALLEEFGISENDNRDIPLVGIVTRMTEQKGLDLVMDKIEPFIEHDQMKLIVLGSGDQKYVDYFNYLHSKYPKKCITYIGYNNNLAHKIYGSADFILIPSRFEPCGLTQMYALKYGTIPIVRQTGGLADTVSEYSSLSGFGNGFSFFNYNSDELAYAIRRGLDLYWSDIHWHLLQKNAMASDFSSGKTALEYLKVFKWALDKVRND